MHNKCDVLESSWKLRHTLGHGKIVFHKTSPWCQKCWGLSWKKGEVPWNPGLLSLWGTRRGSKPASLILWGEGRPSWGFLFNNQTEAAETKYKERISPLDLFLPRRLGEESDSYLLSWRQNVPIIEHFPFHLHIPTSYSKISLLGLIFFSPLRGFISKYSKENWKADCASTCRMLCNLLKKLNNNIICWGQYLLSIYMDNEANSQLFNWLHNIPPAVYAVRGWFLMSFA